MNDQVYGALGQPGVSFIVAIIIGGLAGWFAEMITKSDSGIFTNILMGIIGAFVGNFLAAQLNIAVYGFWANLISATIGAVIVIWAYRAVRGRG